MLPHTNTLRIPSELTYLFYTYNKLIIWMTAGGVKIFFLVCLIDVTGEAVVRKWEVVWWGRKKKGTEIFPDLESQDDTGL